MPASSDTATSTVRLHHPSSRSSRSSTPIPFDYIGSDLYPSVVMAMYDIMGKYLEVPAYKLIGQKVRDGISSAAWCWGGPTDQELADDIVRAANDGYTIFKIHTSPLADIFNWTRIIEEVAPPGFRVHYDFTGRRGRSLGGILPIVARLERDHPIVHWIEDPFDTADVESWRELRRRDPAQRRARRVVEARRRSRGPAWHG